MMGMPDMKRCLAGGSAIALGLLLSGCGGGGGTASTPPPTYTKLADLTGNRTFQSAGIHFTVPSGNRSGFSIQKYGAGVTIAYNAANDSYTLTAPDGANETFSSSTSTPPAGFTPAPNQQAFFNSTNGNLSGFFTFGAPSVNGVPLSYTAVGAWLHLQSGVPSLYYAVAGIPTVASDMPRSGTANYQTSIAGSVDNGSGVQMNLDPTSSATFSANFGAGTVATTIHVAGQQNGLPPQDFGSFSGSGTIASGSPGFSGTLAPTASGSAAVNGEFAGGFFGPQAKEMGYSWYLSGGSMNAEGFVTGTK